jgi:hypothetical protein
MIVYSSVFSEKPIGMNAMELRSAPLAVQIVYQATFAFDWKTFTSVFDRSSVVLDKAYSRLL